MKFYYPLSCLNNVVMLCGTVNVTVGGPTEAVAQTGVYFSEPFTFSTDTINLIDYSPSSLRKSIAASHTDTFLQF